MKLRFNRLFNVMNLAALVLAFSHHINAQEILLADTIVTNGKIVTMDNKEILSSDPGTIVEAMAIRQGQIWPWAVTQR